ncbi:MAG: HEPN domain-containing protein [Candidatus Atribacteria bacterium]|nr:HEPN domain-containing protein [Candidatus Atribacteria bacterium]
MKSNNQELSQYWMEKSFQSLKSAINEFHQKNYDFCANRLYYAVFYAVSSVLIYRKKYYKKHSGVRAAYHREFVKPGIVPIEYGVLYDALLRDREDAD